MVGMKEVKICMVARSPRAPNPPRQDTRGHSHHPHASRDVHRVDGYATEEAGDGASLKAKDTGRN